MDTYDHLFDKLRQAELRSNNNGDIWSKMVSRKRLQNKRKLVQLADETYSFSEDEFDSGNNSDDMAICKKKTKLNIDIINRCTTSTEYNLWRQDIINNDK